MVFVAACGSSSPTSEPAARPESTSASAPDEPRGAVTVEAPSDVAEAPPAPAPPDDELCPRFELPVGSMSMGPSVVGGSYPSDVDAMLAALPERAGAWSRLPGRSGANQRGTAGMATPGATTTLGRGQGPSAMEVRIDVSDLIHRCWCRPGMGEGLRARVLAAGTGDREARTVGGSPAMILRRGGGASVEVWVEDRCEVRIEGAVPETELLAIASEIDWERLRAPCAARLGDAPSE